MSRMLESKARRLAEQRRWVEEHGGDLAGYLARYGSARDARHYGEGGEAIYAADMGELRRAEAEYEELAPRARRW